MDTTELFVLLTCLLPAGVTCGKEVVFVHSRIGGEVHLHCTNMVSPNCSSISWSFYKETQVHYFKVVSSGQVNLKSNMSKRVTFTYNCSLHLRNLKAEDAGTYMCQAVLAEGAEQPVTTHVYLSLLTISSPSLITELQPGGDLVLSCIIFTFYDPGNCKTYTSSEFSLSWTSEDGTQLLSGSRFKLFNASRCNVTLTMKLQEEDNDRTWRCQVKTTHGAVTFLDFTSTFLFQWPSTSQGLTPATDTGRTVELPVTRIMLCAALTVVVLIVCVFTWRQGGKTAKESVNTLELQLTN
ncbi:uncharacterized protein LOC117509379 [Thalassophryne amazonica]|uniref:uncharacterized protein LOC117509379 n=1 Tax=Thalassophryne amazonica TaxID=390379 RepID=UPI001471DA95|nr:uncharacterized protein LOC117509379 [Thalassophryne amazonica]